MTGEEEFTIDCRLKGFEAIADNLVAIERQIERTRLLIIVEVELLKELKKEEQTEPSMKGQSIYRTLMIDDSEESTAAKEFMDSLGLAYWLQNLTGYDMGQLKLPAVRTATGAVFEGLDNIKRYRGAFDLVLSELLEENQKAARV